MNEQIALENMGGKENLLIEILSYALELEEERWAEIENAYREEDFSRYEIKVHALKGAMGCLGLDELSELSRELEFSCRKGNIDFVKQNHATLYDLYQQAHRCIKDYRDRLVEKQNLS